MKIRAAITASLLGLAAVPAQAQPRWIDERAYYTEGLPMRVIMRAVRRYGLTPISRPMLRDYVYVVRAVDRYGDTRRVLVDADTGRVLRVTASRYDDEPRAGRRLRLRPGIEGYGPAPRPQAGLSYDPDFPPPSTRRPLRREQDGSPPIPRPRPAEVTASIGAQPPAESTAPAKPKPLPRVVLPGGPLPKAERTVANTPSERAIESSIKQESASEATSAPSSAAPASTMPPVQPLE